MADENEVGSAYIKLLPSLSSFATTALTGLSGLVGPIEEKLTGMFSKSATAAGGLATEVGVINPALSGAALGAVGLGAAIGAVGVVTGKMASEFQADMERVVTQAGASQQEVDRLKQSVLSMAGQVGQGPDALAASLYHVESAGFRGAEALDIVRDAAKGASIGNADLESVTQAMIGVMASGIGGINGTADAMAMLNTTTGIGDMKMDQLAKSIATGVLPTFATAGLKMNDYSASLATLTDNVTPADEAATRLRMTVSLLEAPSQKATDSLAKIGIGSTTLADDMRQPNGLLVAVTDLKSHLEASGMTASQQAAIIEHAFGGGRTSAGIMTLLQETDRLKTKYGELGDSTSREQQYEEAWHKTQDTTKQKLADSKAALDSLGISIGTLVLPLFNSLASAFIAVVPHIESMVAGVQSLVNAVSGSSAFKDFISAMSSPAGIDAIKTMAAVIGTLLVTALIRAGIQATVSAGQMAAAFVMTQVRAVASLGETIAIMGLYVAGWVRMAAGAMVGAVRTAAAWALSAGASMAGAVAGTVVSVASVLAGWAVMAAGAMADAVVMAAAWLISIGPIALVIAAVVGLVVLIIANWSTVKQWTIDVWHAVSSFIVDAVSTVVDFVRDHWQLLLAILTGPVGLAVLFITDHFNQIVSFMESIPGRIIGALGSVGSMLFNSGKAIIQGLINGIENMAGNVANAVKGVLTKARNLLPFSPAKEGPFSGSGWTTYSGASMMQGLSEGIDSQVGSVTKSVTNAMASTQRAFATSAFHAPSLAMSAGMGGSAVPTSFANAQYGGVSNVSSASSQQITVGNLILQVNGSMDMTSDADKRKLLKAIRDGLVTLETSTR